MSISDGSRFERLLDLPPGFDLAKSGAPDGAWVNILEQQDVSAAQQPDELPGAPAKHRIRHEGEQPQYTQPR